MISQLYILSLRGDTILKRDFLWDIDKTSSELFFRRFRTEPSLSPIFKVQEISFIHTIHNSLIFMCTTKDNLSPTYCLDFLYLIIKLVKDFLGNVSEDIIRKNFIMIYEILDEAVDFGLIQSTNSEEMQGYIESAPILIENFLPQSIGMFSKGIPASAPDRPISSNTEKEEVFIDVVEKVTALYNSHGFLLNGYIEGYIKMKSFLNGKPELEMGVSSYIDRQIEHNNGLKEFNFHRTVDYSRFQQDQVLTIDPPAGEIVLMSYRITEQVDTPFKIFPYIEKINTYKYEISLKIKSMFSNKIKAASFEASFNLPNATVSATTENIKKTKGQKHEFDATSKVVKWEVEEFKGSKELILRVVVNLDSALMQKSVLKQISLKFEIPGYTTTGMAIKYLKNLVANSKQPEKWIRYSTLSSSYVCRI